MEKTLLDTVTNECIKMGRGDLCLDSSIVLSCLLLKNNIAHEIKIGYRARIAIGGKSISPPYENCYHVWIQAENGSCLDPGTSSKVKLNSELHEDYILIETLTDKYLPPTGKVEIIELWNMYKKYKELPNFIQPFTIERINMLKNNIQNIKHLYNVSESIVRSNLSISTISNVLKEVSEFLPKYPFNITFLEQYHNNLVQLYSLTEN